MTDLFMGYANHIEQLNEIVDTISYHYEGIESFDPQTNITVSLCGIDDLTESDKEYIRRRLIEKFDLDVSIS